ncbi:HLH-domain-containing protein [Backusella circina FSU 941]|nr:HLH-domain-containing protein [Backusella circina FSU 941]
MNSTFPIDSYDFMPTSHPSKMHYYDSQIYPAANYHYEPMMPAMQPVVPSQMDLCPSGIHSSPESVSSVRMTPPSLIPSPTLPNCISLTEKINERMAQVNQSPDSFLPEFHQYSKESYESGVCTKRRRRRIREDDDISDELYRSISAAEIRRQVHIQSEQKRRAQIKDGFDVLRQHLPGCVNKKMSKAALLHRTVQHLQHLKKNQSSLLGELERVVQENERLKSTEGRIYSL